MGRNQQAPDFGRDTAFLGGDERLYLAHAMKHEGARHSGCLLLQAPLWLLIRAVIICRLIYSALQTPQPQAALSMLLFGSLIPIGIDAARKWIFRTYYRRTVIIGARVPIAT